MRNLQAVALVLAIGFWAEAGRAADVGDVLPEFTCLDDQGRVWKSSDHVGKRLLVIYFYPSDFARCCTRQASGYRDHQEALANQGAEIIGISCDSIAVHQLFKQTNQLNFSLLSDFQGQVAGLFGVPLRQGGKAMVVGLNGQTIAIPRNFTPARWTFIIDTDGRVLYRSIQSSPMDDSRVVLDFIRERNARQRQ